MILKIFKNHSVPVYETTFFCFVLLKKKNCVCAVDARTQKEITHKVQQHWRVRGRWSQLQPSNTDQQRLSAALVEQLHTRDKSAVNQNEFEHKHQRAWVNHGRLVCGEQVRWKGILQRRLQTNQRDNLWRCTESRWATRAAWLLMQQQRSPVKPESGLSVGQPHQHLHWGFFTPPSPGTPAASGQVHCWDCAPSSVQTECTMFSSALHYVWNQWIY